MIPVADRPADRLRHKLASNKHSSVTVAEVRALLAERDTLAAALREIERMGDYVYKPHDFAAVAQRALAGASRG